MITDPVFYLAAVPAVILYGLSKGGFSGVAILSTPKGVMTGARARQLGVGGEILCKVW